MPENNRVYGSYKNQGLVLIGVHIDPDMAKRDAIIKEKSLKYPVCQDVSKAGCQVSAATYHIEYIPTIFVIGRGGKIVALDPPNLDKAVKDALKS